VIRLTGWFSVVAMGCALFGGRAEARCLARCSCPGPTAWAAEGTVERNVDDGGVSLASPAFVLKLTEVQNFTSSTPPRVGDRLEVASPAQEGAGLLVLGASSGEVRFALVDGGVQCGFDLVPKTAFLDSLRTNTCAGFLADAGIPQNPECDDVRFCGCSGLPAGASFAVLALLARVRRSARR
jgi:hypothetical protein